MAKKKLAPARGKRALPMPPDEAAALETFVKSTRRKIKRASAKKKTTPPQPNTEEPAKRNALPAAEFERHRRAILADPDDVTALGRYADWLTEQGDPQGEFIRVDLEQEQTAIDDPRKSEINERWTALYQEMGESIVEPLSKLKLAPDEPVFYLRHGLLAELTLSKRGMLPQKFADIVKAAPFLTHLILEIPKVPLAEIAKHPAFAQIRVLEAFGQELEITAAGVLALAKSPYAAGLRELDLSYSEFGDEGVAALATPKLANLRKLSLKAVDMTAVGLQSLLKPNHWQQLKVLELGSNHLGPDAAQLLVAATSLANLESLSLSDRRDMYSTVGSLASGAFARQLRILDLQGHASYQVDDANVQGLAQAPFDRLEDFNLSLSGVSLAGLELLAKSRWFSQLRKLHLGSNELPAEAMNILAKVRFPNLQELRLGFNPLGSSGVQKLLAAAWCSGLRVLELWDCQIDAAGAQALADAKLPELEELELADNPLGSAGAAALSKLQSTKLQRISATSNLIKGDGLKALRRRFGDVLKLD